MRFKWKVSTINIGPFFRDFVFLLANWLVLSPLANLFQDPPARCALTSRPRWISMQRRLGGARFIMAWCCPLTFDPQGAFLRMCNVSLAARKGGGSGVPLILYSNKVLPLFVLAMTVILRCPQETNPGYLPCFCCYLHFGGQKGGWL